MLWGLSVKRCSNANCLILRHQLRKGRHIGPNYGFDPGSRVTGPVLSLIFGVLNALPTLPFSPLGSVPSMAWMLVELPEHQDDLIINWSRADICLQVSLEPLSRNGSDSST